MSRRWKWALLLALVALGSTAALFLRARLLQRQSDLESSAERVLHVDDNIRDCTRVRGDRMRPGPSAECLDRLEGDIERARAAVSSSVVDDALRRLATARREHEPLRAAVEAGDGALRDRALDDLAKMDHGKAVSVAVRVGAADWLAKEVGPADHEFERSAAMRVLRDHGLLEAWKRVAVIGVRHSQADADESLFRGASACLLGKMPEGASVLGEDQRSSKRLQLALAGRACGSDAPLPDDPWPAVKRELAIPHASILLPVGAPLDQPAVALALRFAQTVPAPKATAPERVDLAVVAPLFAARTSSPALRAWARTIEPRCEDAKLELSLPSEPSYEERLWSRGSVDVIERVPSPGIDPRQADGAAERARDESGKAPACAGDERCCARTRLESLARALWLAAASEHGRRGELEAARAALTNAERIGPVSAMLWLEAGVPAVALERADAEVRAHGAGEENAHARIARALARIARSELPAALDDAAAAREELRRSSPAATNGRAPRLGMRALWIQVAVSLVLRRPKPADLPRWETDTEPNRGSRDPLRVDSEAFALDVWERGLGSDADREALRAELHDRLELDDPSAGCPRTLAFAALASGNGAEPWLDAVEAVLESKSDGAWRSGALARARCRALAARARKDTSANERWEAAAKALSSLLRDGRSTLLAAYVGL